MSGPPRPPDLRPVTVTRSAFPTLAPTSEADWLRLFADAPIIDLRPSRVTVVAPHPDDETLAVGATLADLAARGVPITVVTVTDGEASHPGRPGLASQRAAEQRAALADLGIPGEPLRLGLPDGSVAHHLEQLVDALVPRCGAGSLVLAPWERDGHTDHDAAGTAAWAAVSRAGGRLLSYPVWAWQWAAPDQLAGLGAHRSLPSEAALAAKAKAVTRFRSQLEAVDGPPIVGPEVLPRFARPFEVLFDVG